MNAQPPLVLVTGATGFIGRALCRALLDQGFRVKAVTRRPYALPPACTTAAVGEMGPDTNWSATLADVDCVIHLAARVHVMRDTASDPLAEFRRANTAATENLARQAAAAGVRRLIYISSVKVNGEATASRPFSEMDIPAPQDAYGVSKLEAEQGLQAIAAETGLETVIIRPPLVYGPEVGANFLRLMGLVKKGIPLPLGSVHNQRSLVYLGNLVDALVRCVRHPGARNRIFLISDGEDLSTPELMGRIARELGKPLRLLPFPPALLRLAGTLIGKGAEMERLLGSLQVDSTSIRQALEWPPPYTVDEGLARTVDWFKRSCGP